jgi:hypothetical protein
MRTREEGSTIFGNKPAVGAAHDQKIETLAKAPPHAKVIPSSRPKRQWRTRLQKIPAKKKKINLVDVA